MFAKFKKSERTASDYYHSANKHVEQGKTETAIEYYNKALTLNPDFIMAYYKRGRVHYAYGNFNTAIVDFNEVLKRENNNVITLTYRGIAYHRLRNFDAALNDLNLAIHLSQENNNVIAHETRGLIFYHYENLKAAIYDFTKAIEIEPSCFRYKFRGDVYCDLQLYQQAREDYQQAFLLKPDLFIESKKLEECGLKRVSSSKNGFFKLEENSIIEDKVESKPLIKKII